MAVRDARSTRARPVERARATLNAITSYEQYITVDDSSKATVFNWNVEKTLLRIPTLGLINYI